MSYPWKFLVLNTCILVILIDFNTVNFGSGSVTAVGLHAIYLLGQGSELHISESVLSPAQSSPPNAGTGLSHDLVRVISPPPQITGQSENVDHSPQFPSMAAGSMTENNSQHNQRMSSIKKRKLFCMMVIDVC